MENNLMEKIVALCKRRGFVYPGSEVYGGLANSWDYGPLGVELKNNIKQAWWKRFVQKRDDMVGIDAALIMNSNVWKASGHVAHFNDPLVEDKKTNERFRLDHLLEENGITVSGMNFEDMVEKMHELNLKSPAGNDLTEPKQFNMMFETHLGPVQEEENKVYLRPETAQAMFVNFKNVLDTARKVIPFGIAQIGHAFRNEITPGNFIFRTREFEQMEIEYFIKPGNEWNKEFDYWLEEMKGWLRDIGVNSKNLYFHEIEEGERAHYSKRTVDIEFEYPFGRKELYGLAYRTDFDLKNHQQASGKDFSYRDPFTNETFVPEVIEPTMGVNRTLLVVLLSAYKEEEKRIVLALPANLAPYKAAIFPLVRNKPELIEKAKNLYKHLQEDFSVIWDDRGNIGKRYLSQDEIGTPYCITVDYQTLEDSTVTIRDRDSMEQQRISVDSLSEFLRDKVK